MLHDTRELPGLVARDHGRHVGLLCYRADGCAWEDVVIVAVQTRRGVGRSLLDAARKRALDENCERLWLVTTNDNVAAQAFYRAVGWRQCAVHRHAVARARRLKPGILFIGAGGVPTEDEIEFELTLE